MDDTARPVGPKPEGLKRGVILGKVRRAPHQLGVWGSAVSSPSGVLGKALVEIDVGAFHSL